MPTTDELQSQINALQSQLNSILGMADDDYIHQYSGEEIDAGITAAGKAVRYDLAQSLTTAQQAQARGNIGAAPDGYGLGDSWDVAPSRDADLITGSGFQMAVLNTPTGNSWWGILSFIYDSDSATQWAIPKNTAAYYGCVCKREKRAGTWGAWEWVNPPMKLGVEYRTTERYLGKPVYIRLEEVAAMPNNTTLTVSNVGVPSGGKLYVDNIVDYRAEFYKDFGVFSVPYNDVVDVPECNGSRYGNGITYSIRTKGVDYSSYAGRIWIKYTKQTD